MQQQLLVRQRVSDGNAVLLARAWPPLLLRQPRLNPYQQLNMPHEQLLKPAWVLRKKSAGAKVQKVVFGLLRQREPKLRQVVKKRQVTLRQK